MGFFFFVSLVFNSEYCIKQTLRKHFFQQLRMTNCLWVQGRNDVTIQSNIFNQKPHEHSSFLYQPLGVHHLYVHKYIHLYMDGLMDRPSLRTLHFKILHRHLVNNNFWCPKLSERVNVPQRNNQCNFPTSKIKPLIFYLISQEFLYTYICSTYIAPHTYTSTIYFFTTQGFLGLSSFKQQYFIILSTPTVETFSGLTASAIGTFVFYSEYFSTSIYLALYLVPQCQDGIYKDSIAIPI